MKIDLFFSEKKFEYDVYNLVRTFYPEADLTIRYMDAAGEDPGKDPEEAPADLTYRFYFRPAEISVEISEGSGMTCAELLCLSDPGDRIETKNQLKRLVYSGLVRRCGHELPWGDLSGIRPVKLVTGLLESGFDPEDALAEMQKRYLVSAEKASLARDVAVLEQKLLGQFDCRSGYSLYVDIPFCPSICLYCTFGSHPIGAWADAVEPYLAALKRELAYIADQMQDVRLDTIYIGGGTPTSISAGQMDLLLDEIGRLFPVGEVREFTVEAGRPDTIDPEMLRVLRAHPVTRISINPQTMNRKTLELIGRQHTVEQTEAAFALAREMGFDHINMDMIVGLPGEGADEVRASLERIKRLAPDAFTVHSLALKRAARLNQFRDIWRPVSFDNSAEIMRATADCAAQMEMQPYYLYRQKNMAGNFENVGYAKSGKACLYNILIMEEKQTIVGAGCGAATKLVLPDGSRGGRAENVKSLREYLDRTDEMITRKRALLEHPGANRV